MPDVVQPTPIDEALLAAARAGDERAHAAIYVHYARRMYTLIYRLLPRRAQAEDVLHDTFVEVLRNIGSFTGAGSFEGWLRAIAVNKALTQLRSPWQRSMAWIDRTLHSELEFESEPAPDAVLATRSELESALQMLPPISRAVVWLHDVEGYTHGEISRLLSRTPSFSKSQLARAHKRLRELLDSNETQPCTPATQPVSTSS